VKKKPAAGSESLKKTKTRHIMRSAKRPAKKADPTENRRRCAYGDNLDSPAVLLFDFLRQVSSRPSPALCWSFTEELSKIYRSGDGSILRALADLIEVPISRPALEIAWSQREYWQQAVDAGVAPPGVKKKDIIKSIIKGSGCNERTAEKAARDAGLAEIFGWKAGRPRSEDS
jgi:hypothetical protein